MFLGTFTLRLDEKHRLALPAKYREEVAEGVVIAKGEGHCLNVWTKQEWDRVAAEIDAEERAAVTDQQRARVLAKVRRVFPSASDETPDRQGRITVPASLRTYAGLTRACTVTGANTRLELWDSVVWDARRAADDADDTADHQDADQHADQQDAG